MTDSIVKWLAFSIILLMVMFYVFVLTANKFPHKISRRQKKGMAITFIAWINWMGMTIYMCLVEDLATMSSLWRSWYLVLYIASAILVMVGVGMSLLSSKKEKQSERSGKNI